MLSPWEFQILLFLLNFGIRLVKALALQFLHVLLVKPLQKNLPIFFPSPLVFQLTLSLLLNFLPFTSLPIKKEVLPATVADPGSIDQFGVVQLSAMININNQSSNSNFPLSKKAHINGVKLTAIDGLDMSGKQDEIVLQSDLDIKQKESLFRRPFVKISVDLEQTVFLGQPSNWLEYSQHQILVQRIYLYLYLLILLQKQLHLQNRLQVKNVKYLQTLTRFHYQQKLFTLFH